MLYGNVIILQCCGLEAISYDVAGSMRTGCKYDVQRRYHTIAGLYMQVAFYLPLRTTHSLRYMPDLAAQESMNMGF